MRRGIAGVQHHQARVFDPAVGIFIGALETRVQRRAFDAAAQIKGGGARQDRPSAKIVIKEQPEPDQPGRPPPAHPGHEDVQQPGGRRLALEAHVAVIGQHKSHRPTDMRHCLQQDFTLDQRLMHQPHLEILEVAQPAMKQLGRGAGGCRGKVIHFRQNHRHPAPCRIARNTAAIDAAADDEQIGRGGAFAGQCHGASLPRIWVSKTTFRANEQYVHSFDVRSALGIAILSKKFGIFYLKIVKKCKFEEKRTFPERPGAESCRAAFVGQMFLILPRVEARIPVADLISGVRQDVRCSRLAQRRRQNRQHVVSARVRRHETR